MQHDDMSNLDFKDRLTRLRNINQLTMKELAERTNIPEKTVQKYHYGDAEPSLSRLTALADALKVETSFLVSGKADQQAANDPLDSTNIEPLDEEEAITTDLYDEDGSHDLNSVRKLFRSLDTKRADGLRNHWYSFPADIEELSEALSLLPVGDILLLAEERRLYPPNNETLIDIKAQTPKGMLALEGLRERLIDTAFFMRDLLTCCTSKLQRLASEYDLQPDKPGFLSDTWSSEDVMLTALRGLLREKALLGADISLEDIPSKTLSPE